MGDPWTWIFGAGLGVIVGAVLGAAIVVVIRSRREAALRVELALLQARIHTEETISTERNRALAEARDQLRGVFGELARDTLQSNSELFLQLARERLSRQQQEATQALQERETAIDALVQPIREALARTESQIHSIERERIDAFATLKTQLEVIAGGQASLSRETRNLVTALRRPGVRGQWGEITLKRLVELSGMTEHVDFQEQHTQAGDAGAIRPDMVVHMPERRDIVIDVKTPLDAYLAAIEATDDTERSEHLRRHARAVAARVRELAAKNYWAQFAHSPDFVVLFLPGDQFLSAALNENPGLLDESLRQKVMLATPTSLVALLKAVAYGWKQTALADNAAEIRRLGEELYTRLAVFGEHLGKLGRSLGNSVDYFNKAVGSLEHNVLPAARRFPDLGLRSDRELPILEPVASLTRQPQSHEASPEKP